QAQIIGHACVLAQNKTADRCDMLVAGPMLVHNGRHDAMDAVIKPELNRKVHEIAFDKRVTGEKGTGGFLIEKAARSGLAKIKREAALRLRVAGALVAELVDLAGRPFFGVAIPFLNFANEL